MDYECKFWSLAVLSSNTSADEKVMSILVLTILYHGDYGTNVLSRTIFFGRALRDISCKNIKSMKGVHFTILPASPCGAEFYEIWHTRSTHRRNHVCQILSWSVQGLRSSDTPKIAISHWLAVSPVQQYCHATLWSQRHKSCMTNRQIRVKKLLVQLNALLHVTQSKFNPYKREIVCLLLLRICQSSFVTFGTHKLVHSEPFWTPDAKFTLTVSWHVLWRSINWLAKRKNS